jgi:hypothetical protein
MPCIKCDNGKWRIGSGKCMYKSKESCEKALRDYHATKNCNELIRKVISDGRRKRSRRY